MALQIVTKKRFISSMKKTTSYLKQEWNKTVAIDFVKIVDKKITLLASQPNIGSNTSIKNTKSILAGRGYQNRIYYRVENKKLIIVNLKDIRKSPKKNRFNQ
jgi:plasmid stabilization system protein ParE